jgi:dihydrofolate reductase
MSPMAQLTSQITMSLDGFVAGPDQGQEHPLGVGGEQLHEWALELAAWREAHGHSGGKVNASTAVMDEMLDNVGAVVMGRNMFGPVRGDWGDASWKGWWGDDPPFHVPVFVLTHHARDAVQMQGGTTFHFVTDGIESALDQALEAADGKDVHAGGGASCVQQCLNSGRLSRLTLSVVPVLLGSGARLLENLDPAIKLEQIAAIEAPGVTHLKYAISV